jgi:hypothetical protein
MNKKLTRIISFILAIMIIITVPFTAYADGENGNGTGDAGSSGTHIFAGGAASYKSAYLIYIVDGNGNLITPVVEAAISGAKVPPTDGNFNYEKSKFGNQAPSRFTTISGIPTPFSSSGDGNGAVLKSTLLSKNGDSYLASAIIKTYFGDSVKEQFIKSSNDMYLIFEGVYWFTMNEGNLKGQTVVATASGWAKAQQENGYPQNGTKVFSRYTNNIFANCMKFEVTQLGLNPCPSGKQTNDVIMSSASGIISVWNNEVNQGKSGEQTTYDESKGDTPAPPADESDGAYTIVKNYRYSNDGGNTYIDAGCYNIKNIASKIIIENEQSYKVVGWKISNQTSTNINSVTWEGSIPGKVTQTGTTEKTVQLSSTERCLYVLLEKTSGSSGGTGDFEISQASLTKRVRFSESSKTNGFNSHSFGWTSGAFSLSSCSGHSYTDGCGNMTNHSNDKKKADGTTDHSGDTTYCGGHTDYCSNFKLLDDRISVSLKNQNVSTAPKIMVQKHGWQNVVENTSASSLAEYWHKFRRPSNGADTPSRSGWDYVCVLWRGEDDLTVAQWKNDESTNNLMREIGFKVANTLQGTRKTSDFVNTFTAKFIGAYQDNSTEYGASTASPHSNQICTQTMNYSFKSDTALSLSNIKVLVKVYSGQSNRDSSNEALKKNQAEVGSITFYPYIKMRYDKYTSSYENVKSQTAYVLGNYARTLNLRNGVTVKFETEDDGNTLEVQSNQWSTHTSLIKNINSLFGTTDNAYKVIPGGATLSIKNRDDAKSKDVKVITYQCILEGDGKTQVDYTGSVSGDFTEATADANHKSTVNSVVESLKQLRLELFGNKSARKEPFSGENITKSKKFNGKSISSDSKYNWDDFNDLYINVAEGNTSKEKYVFSADADGNIRMNGEVIVTKGQGAESINNRTAKTINDKTQVVTQLVKVLERNTGSDNSTTWSSADGKWYNEAFDGVTVLVSTTTINTGLWDLMERSTVFDPKLTPSQSSKESIGNSFYSFQMRTAAYSDLYEGEVNRVGNFMGVNVYSNVDLIELFKTDKWFSSNITTQDLN